ncbi:MAG: hypothetical protein U9P12_00885 [Verrucomicrobiota bacterium]|nr:hypothetical protein [Verrucomicrobiota bacterium]
MKIHTITFVAAFTLISSLYAELTKVEIKEIAEQYADACINQDFKAWQKLSVNGEHRLRGDFTRGVTSGRSVKSVRIKEVDEHNIRIQFQWKSGSRVEGWLQLLPDGKIKYDPIVFAHPIPQAFKHYGIINMIELDDTQFSSSRKSSSRKLKETGIPLFGYDPEAPIHDQKKALEAIREWLIEHGAEWDSSEPKLACPKDQLKDCLKRYK